MAAKNGTRDRRKWNVFQVTSRKNLKKIKLKGQVGKFLRKEKLESKIAYDKENKKCLRFSILKKELKQDKLSQVIKSIQSVVKDAGVTWPGIGVINPDLTKPIPVKI